MKRILILTSHTGGGHVSLAEALRDILAPHHEITILDPQHGFFHSHYRFVSRHALWLWAAEFRAIDTSSRALSAHKTLSALSSRRLVAMLDEAQPDIVITTYAFLSYEIARAIERWGKPTPLVMLFSDPNGVHQAWLTERQAAATFATSMENYEQALAAGFSPDRLHLTGWPVREQFRKISADARSETLEKLNLNPAWFTIFLQGGGEGAAKFTQTVESVIAVPRLQIILAAGTNVALQRHFADRNRVGVVPFTPQIAPYMAAADVVMGKAGPNMLFEAVTLGKPFIATTFIPGQEEVNLEFIRRHNLGWVSLDVRERQGLLTQLVARPPALTDMMNSVEEYRAWNDAANESIVPAASSLLAR